MNPFFDKRYDGFILAGVALLIPAIYLSESSGFPHRIMPVADALLYYSEALKHDNVHALVNFPLSKLFVLYLRFSFNLTRHFNELCGSKITGIDTVILFNVFIYTVSIVVVTRLGQNISRITGVLSGLLMLGYGPALFYQTVLLPVILILGLETICLYWWLSFMKTPKISFLIFFSIIFGVLIEIRPHFLIILPALFLLLIFKNKYKTRGKKILVSFILVIGAYLPVMLINFTVSSHQATTSFLPRSSWGLNLYIGNHRQANGLYNKIPFINNQPAFFKESSRKYVEKTVGLPVSNLQENMFWADQAISFIKKYPKEAFWLFYKKFKYLFSNQEFPLNYDYTVHQSFSGILPLLIVRMGFLLSLSFVFIFTYPDTTFSKSLKIWFAAFCFGLLIFFINSEHRMPLLPLAALLSAGTLHQLYLSIGNKGYGKLMFISFVFFIFTFLSLHQKVGWSHHQTYHQIGEMSLKIGNRPLAISAFELSLTEKHDFLPSLLILWKLYSISGNGIKANEYYKRILEIHRNKLK